jgi:hypothetical protein
VCLLVDHDGLDPQFAIPQSAVGVAAAAADIWKEPELVERTSTVTEPESCTGLVSFVTLSSHFVR